jgi:hypothetical protein
MPTISLLEMLEAEAILLAATKRAELLFERTSLVVAIDTVPTLEEPCSMSDGICTIGWDGWCKREFSSELLECILIKVLLAALPLEWVLSVFAVTNESVVSIGSV